MVFVVTVLYSFDPCVPLYLLADFLTVIGELALLAHHFDNICFLQFCQLVAARRYRHLGKLGDFAYPQKSLAC